MRLAVPQIRSQRYGEENNVELSLIEPGPSTPQLVAIATEVS
jgi:hypothetical protein